MNSSDSTATSFPIGSMLFVFAFGGAIGHCWWVGDPIATAVLALVAVGGVSGYFCGVWRTLATSVGAYAGYQLADPTAQTLLPFLTSQYDYAMEPAKGQIIAGLTIGLIVTSLLVMAGVIIRRNETAKHVDQCAGFAFGLVSSTACLALLFWVLLASESSIERARIAPDSDSNRVIALEKLHAIIKATKTSYIMTGLRSWNPIVEVAFLRDLKTQIESAVNRSNESNGSGIESLQGTLSQLLQGSMNGKLIQSDSTPPNALDSVK